MRREELELKLIPKLTPESFRECFDNSPSLYFTVASIVWFIISFLLNVSIKNIWGCMSILLFFVMTIAPISLFTSSGIDVDYKEKKSLTTNIILSLLGVSLIIVSAIAISGVFKPSQLSSMSIATWMPYRADIPTNPELLEPFAQVYINFKFLSSTMQPLGLDMNMVYDVLTNFLLVAPGEERVFRGVIPYFMTKGTKSPWLTLIFSTLIWALCHTILAYTGPEMIMWTMAAYAGGFWLTYIMIQSKDIFTSEMSHGFYNVILRIFAK